MLTWKCLLLVGLACNAGFAAAQKTRTFYIGATEIDWDYTPLGLNYCGDRPFSVEEKVFTENIPGERIGSVYKKVVYRGYTDDSFETLATIPAEWEHLGILGPVIQLEEGDTAEVIFKNLVNIDVSIRAMGLTDVSSSLRGQDRANPPPIAPGKTQKYLWRADSIAAPSAESNETSTLWLYRPSHEVPEMTNLGLVGPIIVTKKGLADEATGAPKGVDTQIVTLYLIQNENESPYLDQNIASKVYQNEKAYNKGPRSSTLNVNVLFRKADGLKEDEGFVESNTMHTINGLMYCNNKAFNAGTITPEAPAPVTRWYVASLGSETDLHTPHWHGHTAIIQGKRRDEKELLAGSVWVADMKLDAPGTWLMHCHVNDHLKAGMLAKYTVGGTPINSPFGSSTSTERVYYVVAEEIDWDFAAGGIINQCNGEEIPSLQQVFVNSSEVMIGTQVTKAVYREYTDETFTTPKNRTIEEEHLGILGPVLRAIVGDTIVVHFRNNLRRSASMHPHGVFYNKTHEGAPYFAEGSERQNDWGDIVQPNGTHVYRWFVPARAGPGPKDASSIVWLYHSHVDEIADTNAGLVGLIDIVDPARATADARPKDVDIELFALFTVFDELVSTYSLDNIRSKVTGFSSASSASVAALISDPFFQESSLKHSINGYIFCNGPAFKLSSNQKSMWHLVALGNEVDLHTPNWEGKTLLVSNQRVDTIALLPSSMINAVMNPLTPGNFSLHCQVTDHRLAGMYATVEVSENTTAPVVLAAASSGQPREDLPMLTYYIAAEEIDHDYAPSKKDGCSGADLDESEEATVFTVRSDTTIGSKYKKALYRRYTDDSFEDTMDQPEYLGIVGPVIRVTDGQKVKIVFKNMLKDYDAGIFFNALTFLSGPSPSAGLKPGETATYEWFLDPASSGFGSEDASSMAFMYYSPVSPVEMSQAGLVGPLIVVNNQQLKNNGTSTPFPADVDREFVLLFAVTDENLSPYLDANIEDYIMKVSTLSTVQRETLKLDGDFMESNLMHGINGFVYCNLPPLVINKNAKTRWHFLSVGTENGIHTPNMPGVVVSSSGERSTSIDLLPGTTKTVDILTSEDTPEANYMLKCDVADHLEGGMKAKVILRSAAVSHGISLVLAMSLLSVLSLYLLI